MRNAKPGQSGFTLIELMIVVVVVAILAAIAFPQYRDYVVRSNRAVAKSLLVQVADRQEQFFTDRKAYATDMTALGYPGATTIFVGRDGNPTATDPGDALYAIALSGVSATGYTLTATPRNTQADDTKCTAMAINQAGQRTSQPVGSECW